MSPACSYFASLLFLHQYYDWQIGNEHSGIHASQLVRYAHFGSRPVYGIHNHNVYITAESALTEDQNCECIHTIAEDAAKQSPKTVDSFTLKLLQVICSIV